MLTALFVAAEFALVAVNRTRLERLAADGNRQAKGALDVLARLSFHLSGAQLGITLCSLVLGFLAEPTIAHALHAPVAAVVGEGAAGGVSVALALALATIGSMVLGELVPKNLVVARPVRAALALARPLRLFDTVFAPLIRVANDVANWVVRRFGVEPREELASVRSLEELAVVIRTSGAEGTIDRRALTLLNRSLRFGEKTADDAMVPRVEVQAVTHDDTLADLVAASMRTGTSRFPVTGEDIDDVVGVVHVKDVYRVPAAERATTPVSAIVAAVPAVPEARPLEEVLGDLRADRSHLAVVVDEYGGTAGILTMEDLLEEIVGEIADEYDPPPGSVTGRSAAGELTVPAGLHPDEVLDACGFAMPDGPYETLAGFVLDRLGHLPGVSESFYEDGWHFTVTETDRRRVATVAVTPPPDDDGDEGRGSAPRLARAEDRT